jgi:hypothetical protein
MYVGFPRLLWLTKVSSVPLATMVAFFTQVTYVVSTTMFMQMCGQFWTCFSPVVVCIHLARSQEQFKQHYFIAVVSENILIVVPVQIIRK